MKRFLLALGLIVVMSSFVSTNAKVNVNVNIGLQPAWGPIGYDYAGYYYFPDIDIYYNVNTSQFVYLDGRVWVSARYLPYRYRNYDLYPMYKVVINDPDPWIRNDRYRRQYAHYRGYRNQPIIMNSRDSRYHDSRNNRVSWIDSNRRPSSDHYSSDNHRLNNSDKSSKLDRRPANHDNNSNNNGRPNSHSNHNNRYSSERNKASLNSASKGNNSTRDRNSKNQDTQRTAASRYNNNSDRRSSSVPTHVNSNTTSSRGQRSVASVARSSRSSRSNNTENSSNTRNNRVSR